MNGLPRVSFVLATHNRRAVALETLARVRACGLTPEEYEIIVVDSASTDGTGDAIEGCVDRLIRLRKNVGSCAKAVAIEYAAAPILMFLDDDSFPRPDSVARMLERFEADPQLGAAGFSVHGPGGRPESSALPDVFHGCGVGLRAEALREVGGLDPSFFMQVEEYDLSFRLVAAGWTVDVFDDLHVDHLKVAQSRRSDRVAYFDVRNNLRLAARYLPAPFFQVYRADWLQRYGWLASKDGHLLSFTRGAASGWLRSLVERRSYRSRRLKPGPLESFFRWGFVGAHMANLAREGVARIVLAGLGKNIYAFHRAANQSAIEIVAIGDDRFHAPNRHYRGTSVLDLDTALGLESDAVVVGHTAGVFAEQMRKDVAMRTTTPVHNWFPMRETGESQASSHANSREPATVGPPTADNTGVGAEFALGAPR